jgi:hypothetical protein
MVGSITNGLNQIIACFQSVGGGGERLGSALILRRRHASRCYPGLAKAISDSLIAADISAMVNPARPDEKEMTMTVGVKPYELLK